tara:strand:+ start:594 stop:902 length:309 start_codon:yes stop_codon:yes gene_type:complete
MAPNLIDNNSKKFIHYSLMEMHQNKITNYNLLYNLIIFISFVTVTAVTLYCLYKGKQTDEEKYIKSYKEKQYILSKMRAIQEKQYDNSQITNMPPLKTMNEY